MVTEEKHSELPQLSHPAPQMLILISDQPSLLCVTPTRLFRTLNKNYEENVNITSWGLEKRLWIHLISVAVDSFCRWSARPV